MIFVIGLINHLSPRVGPNAFHVLTALAGKSFEILVDEYVLTKASAREILDALNNASLDKERHFSSNRNH